MKPIELENIDGFNREVAMNIEDALFWLVAVLQVLVAVIFVLLIHKAPPRLHKPRNFVLARGQFQDGLLSAAVMWTIFLNRDAPFIKDALDVAGALLLLWLIWRTMHRIRWLRHRD